MSSDGPRIIAVLVTHDGASTLRRTLTAVAAQTQPGIQLHAVDNASEDGTAALLVDLVGPDRVLLSDIDLGFPAAVDLALDAVDAEDARYGREPRRDDDLVLLLHDDLELEPDAVEHLVAAMRDDDTVAIVGPKLRWADEPTRLQSVGATIDLTGRVDDGIDPGELDQGQRDADRRVLFVPTAGMLVRRRVFDALGRFDPRAHAFREDLDLCWRAAVAGHDVEVVPAAVGRHAALAAEHARTGRVADLGPRYLAERNTLAALLTNYGPARLLFVLPLAFLVGAAKIAGFLVTRRINDARSTVAAWGWNIVNLRGTLRRRRVIQGMRRRSDAEIAPLFGRIMPRLQAYLEAVLDRIVGEPAPGELGSAEAQPSATLQGELRDSELPGLDLAAGDADEDLLVVADRARAVVETERPPGLRGAVGVLVASIASRPVQVFLPPAVLLLLLGLRDAVIPGPVRGGDLQPFPEGPTLVARHLAGWHDSGATLSSLDPSPAQLVLGALQVVAGSGALRMLLLAAPVLAWAAAMRALARHLPPTLPRTVLALAYATSPPVIIAATSGDIVTLVVAIVTPVIVIAATTVLDADASVERVWRRLAVSAFLLAIVIAFAPTLVLVLPLVLLAGVGHATFAVDDPRWRRMLVTRSAMLALLPLPLLGPWLLSIPDVLRAEVARTGVSIGGHPAAWLALDPSGRMFGIAGAGLLLAGIAGALVISAADVGRTTTRAAVAALLVAFLLPLSAWWLDAGAAAIRTGPFLVAASAALVGLAALGLRHAPAVLSRFAFGWRQLGVGLASTGVVLMLAAGLVDHAVTGAPGLSRQDAVPAYLATLGPTPPDRVLVIGASAAGVVWEVVPAAGPDVSAFGVRHDPAVHHAIAEAVGDLLAGSDPRATARLGRLGVGLIMVPDGFTDPTLAALLRVQTALDPLPTLTGSVSRVNGAIPGAGIVSETSSVDRVPDPTVPPRAVVAVLQRDGSERLVGDSGSGGDLLAVVPFGAGWRVLVDGSAVPMISDAGLVRALGVPAGAEIEVVATPSATRTALLRGQAFWALLILSLGARPPAFAIRNARRTVSAA